jgi:hypothetical protein
MCFDSIHKDAYGNIVTDEIKQFHKQRTMFALIKGHFFYMENSEKSHIDWFIDEGWITDKDDPAFETTIRGYFNHSGVFFYKGMKFDALNYETDINEFLYCIQIIKPLIKENLPVFWGLNTYPELTVYTPKKSMGKLYDLYNEETLDVNSPAYIFHSWCDYIHKTKGSV